MFCLADFVHLIKFIHMGLYVLVYLVLGPLYFGKGHDHLFPFLCPLSITGHLPMTFKPVQLLLLKIVLLNHLRIRQLQSSHTFKRVMWFIPDNRIMYCMPDENVLLLYM
jgi:hypothetical protein